MEKSEPDVIGSIGRSILAWTRTTPLEIAYSGEESEINIRIQFLTDQDIFGDLAVEVGRAFSPPNGLIQLNDVFKFALEYDPTGNSHYSSIYCAQNVTTVTLCTEFSRSI